MAEALKTATVSEEEIRTFYEENRNQFAKGGTVRAKHILTDSEDKCKEILEEIENGTKAFEMAAQSYPGTGQRNFTTMMKIRLFGIGITVIPSASAKSSPSSPASPFPDFLAERII